MPGDAAQIVGRERELSIVDRVLDGLPAGAYLQIVGEAGIGKTRLLEALRASAEERGLLVAEGSGWEFERDYPFGVVVDALDEYLESLDAREVERRAGDVATELAAVFPALRTLGGRRDDRAGHAPVAAAACCEHRDRARVSIPTGRPAACRGARAGGKARL